MAANSLSQTSQVIAGLVGVTAAGILVSSFHHYWPAFVIDALTFFIGAVLIMFLQVNSDHETSDSSRESTGFIREIKDGLSAIAQSRILIGALIAATVGMLGLGALNVLLVPFIVDTLHISSNWFGAIQASQTAAMIVSGSAIALLQNRLKPTRLVTMSLFGLGISASLMSLATNVWFLFPIMFGIGSFMTPINASLGTIVQTGASPSVLGRIASAMNSLISTASIISIAAAGILADVFGVRPVILGGEVLIAAAGLLTLGLFREG